MADIKQVIIIIVGTIGLVVLLGAWLAYRDGTLAILNGEPIEDLEIPLSPETLEANTLAAEEPIMPNENNRIVTFKTNRGDITLEMFTQQMPTTTGNFISLAEQGFYNGTKFHRVINGFMIQGGDPNTKEDDVGAYGTGGPGFTIEDEFVEGERLTNMRGTIAMANTGVPNSGGSQFFINLVDNTNLDFDKEPLASKHPVFGRVIEGMEIVDEIALVPTDPRDVPIEPVVIEEVVVN